MPCTPPSKSAMGTALCKTSLENPPPAKQGGPHPSHPQRPGNLTGRETGSHTANSGVRLEGIRSRAHCKPATVATMKVPSTKTGEAVSVHKACWHRGSKVPKAITAWATFQTFLRGQAGFQRRVRTLPMR